MMADNQRTTPLLGSLAGLAGAVLIALMSGPAFAAAADSPAIEVNPKALDAVPLPQAKPKKTKEPDQVAALPSGNAEPTDDGTSKFAGRHEQVVFQPDQDALSAEAIEKLSTLASDLTGNDQRIELSGFAGTAAQPLSDANRLALKHALLVRDYLVGKGIAESRVLVRALGPAPNGPKDRVDIAFLTR